MGLLTETCLLAQQSLPSQYTKPQAQEKGNTQDRKELHLEVRDNKRDVDVVDLLFLFNTPSQELSADLRTTPAYVKIK